MIGVGPELTPYYYSVTKMHRERFHQSEVGKPGKLQVMFRGRSIHNFNTQKNVLSPKS